MSETLTERAKRASEEIAAKYPASVDVETLLAMAWLDGYGEGLDFGREVVERRAEGVA